MDVRHQVFVSSTFRDLIEEQREVMTAILELDCIPAGMELFPASNETALRLIRDVIEQSDYYIVIVDGKYGSMDADGVSYTETEYDYAVSIVKPVLGFLHRNPEAIPAGQTDFDPDSRKRLESFRAKVERRHCKYWTSAADLGGVVSRSLVQEKKRNPMAGWVRADSLGGPGTLERLMEPQKENERLTARLDGLLGETPPGTEEHGEDKVTLSITYGYKYDDPKKPYTTSLSWDEIISLVGPFMLQEASEQSICSRVAQQIGDAGKEAGIIRENTRNDAFGFRPELTPEAQSTVIVQLIALRIIEKSTRKRSLTDTRAYWKLTAYGEHYLTQLHARRRIDR